MNGGKPLWQNLRCSGLFKYPDGKCSYADAIVWKSEREWDKFTGSVYIDDKNFELIGSSQYVNFTFKPKTFYVDVIYVPISKTEAERKKLHYIEGFEGFGDIDNCYYTVLKDPKQLDDVFSHYERRFI